MGIGQYNSLGEYCAPHTASSVFLILEGPVMGETRGTVKAGDTGQQYGHYDPRIMIMENDIQRPPTVFSLYVYPSRAITPR